MNKMIKLIHGDGGKHTKILIEQLFTNILIIIFSCKSKTQQHLQQYKEKWLSPQTLLW